MTSKEYFKELTLEFPLLKTEIESEGPEMIHTKMEIFSAYNLEQIKSGNYSELKRCFDFQECRIESLELNLINALNVSYCETLLLGECAADMPEVKKIMPPKLKQNYIKYEEYYTSLKEISKKTNEQ